MGVLRDRSLYLPRRFFTAVSVLVLSQFVRVFLSCHNCQHGRGESPRREEGEGHRQRPSERGGCRQAGSDSLHGGCNCDAASDVPHPALPRKLQGCWKGEPMPPCSDCSAAAREGDVGVHRQEVHAQGAVGKGCFLQGNPVERFHPWPCCARGHRLVQGSNGPVFHLSARVCQGGEQGGTCDQVGERSL